MTTKTPPPKNPILPVPKIKIRPRTSDILSVNQVWHLNEYNSIVQEMKRHFAGGDPTTSPVILDAGSYIGATALYWRHHFPWSFILCLEPDRDNFLMLNDNLGIEAWAKQWALHNHIGKGVMRSPIDDTRGWSRQLVLDPPDKAVTDPCMVDVVDFQYCLDLITSSTNHKGIDFVKMDIEGSEKFIFGDAISANAILKQIKFIAIEIHEKQFPGTKQKVMLSLEQAGYQVWTRNETTFGINKNLVKT